MWDCFAYPGHNRAVTLQGHAALSGEQSEGFQRCVADVSTALQLLLLPAEVCSELRLEPSLNLSLNQKAKLPEPRGELNETATLTVRCQLPWPKAEWAWSKPKERQQAGAQGCQVADKNAGILKPVLGQGRDQ
uniref:GG24906 n=1 Tax=Drosophila erecta TaxID=7220 RepID=B3NYS2_DROER